MGNLNAQLSKETSIFHLKVWELIGIAVGLFIVVILTGLSSCLTSRKKLRRAVEKKLPFAQIPVVSKEIKEVRVEQVSTSDFVPGDGILLTIQDKSSGKESDKVLVHLGLTKIMRGNSSRSDSFPHLDKDVCRSLSEEDLNSGIYKPSSSSSHPITAPSPLVGLPEFSHLGWGHWFTLRDLELATNRFSKDNVLGEGGYGVVYRGCLINGTTVAVKKILNNVGQAEKEFRAEVEAIGHVRHKNLVRLLGYCIEGTHRMLVYEYVNNGNLEQWLHGAMRQHGYLTWEARIKVLVGTAKANKRETEIQPAFNDPPAWMDSSQIIRSLLIVFPVLSSSFFLAVTAKSNHHGHMKKHASQSHPISHVSASPSPAPEAAPGPSSGDGSDGQGQPIGVFDVRKFGAAGDGSTDDTDAFKLAWDTACRAGGRPAASTILAPRGRSFMIQSTIFTGPCKSSIVFQIDGTIMPPDGPESWPMNKSKRQWLVFYRVNGMSMQGGGLIDGKGQKWWNLPCKPHKGVNGTTMPSSPCDSPVVSV
ncbi:hypothetical protein SAY86_012397 [Trapa natans]|uniref:non-specific serine/threonine protein kinase n=1 Tax=Trapa natans TaxID=22666 RepID=A0AAN7RD38_TRANT|nr:hypothetical protein SAY86_012397 [Trapa natans]